MVNPDELNNRMAVHQPRPFDRNEPSAIAPVSDESDDEEPISPPGEHAEIPHPPNTVVEGDEDDAD